MPSITANSLLIGKYCLMLCFTSFLCGQPLLYKPSAPAGMISLEIHTGMFTEVLMAFTFIPIPSISWSLFSVCLLWHSQSVMCKSWPGLYLMSTLYWCIHSIMHYSCWNSVTTSLLSITTNALWSVIIHTSTVKK